MKTIDVIVTADDGSGEEVSAKAVVCPKCGIDDVPGFVLYYIEERLHLQCCNCSTTFCEHGGACWAGVKFE